MSPDSRKEMEEKMSGEKMLLVGDLGRVMYGMVAALAGDTWADTEYFKGFSVEEAVRLTIKFSDYNRDGYMSRAESALLSMPTELFSALSPMGGKGEMLSVDNLLDALEDVSGCEEVLVVDKPGDLSLKTLYMPRGRCSVLIMPGWNVPASYPPTEPLTCGDGSGSGSGSGPDGDRPYGAAGRRRLLAKQATRSQRSGSKSTRSKAAGQGLHRVLAKHHQHHMLSSTLSLSTPKTSATKKRQLVNLQKRQISSKQARARRRSHVHEELRKLKGSRPAARVRAMVRSRRTSVERALAKSTEQSAVRVVKRGSRSLLDKHGMRAYRSAMGKMRQIIKSLGHRLEAVVKNVPRDATSNLRKVSRNDARNKKANTRTYHEPEAQSSHGDTHAPRDWQNCTWSLMYNCSDIGRMDEEGNYRTGYPPGDMCRSFGCDLMYGANGTFVPLWKGCPAACAEFQ